MSMISEQIERLRHIADCGFSARGYTRELYDAARTIEELSTKLANANMERSTAYYNDGWIPCSSGEMPKDGEDVLVWFEYFRYGEYNRLYQTRGIGSTYNGEWSGFVNGQSGWHQLRIIAWQPLPESYKGE